jgi:hypothetical protein
VVLQPGTGPNVRVVNNRTERIRKEKEKLERRKSPASNEEERKV